MRIRYIYCEDFPPFGEMDIPFPAVEDAKRGAEVHLLAGVNGTGKTRILSLLAGALGGPKALKVRLGDTHAHEFLVAATNAGPGATGQTVLHRKLADAGISAEVYAFKFHGGEFRTAKGRDLDGNSPRYAYGGDAYLDASNITAMAPVTPPERSVALSFRKPVDASQKLAQAISNLKMTGWQHIGNYGGLDVARQKSRQLRLGEHLDQCLHKLTGQEISFEVVSSPSTMLVVKWGSGQKPLPFHLLPDGLRSILGWLVELAVLMDLHYPDAEKPWDQPLIVLLDEVERHLHPGWQRHVIPMAQQMFPGAQFFVATHSPFVIASLNEGWIHNFTLGKDGKVTAEPPVPASEGDSYVSVLASIMGVTELYDPETETMLKDYRELRTKALKREAGMHAEAVRKADDIAARSVELGYMMAKEKAQLDKLLNGHGANP